MDLSNAGAQVLHLVMAVRESQGTQRLMGELVGNQGLGTFTHGR